MLVFFYSRVLIVQIAMEIFKHNFVMVIHCAKTLPPFQIVGRLTFLISSLTTRPIQKFVQNIIFLLWLALLVQVLEERFKFDYVCINFLNKTSGQI